MAQRLGIAAVLAGAYLALVALIGLGIIALCAVVLLGAGCWRLVRRDA